jgi:O-antigen/teichoic acid export membrane protein
MTALPPHSTPLLQASTSAVSTRRKSLETVARNTTAMLGGQTLIKVFGFIFSVYVVRRLGDVHFGRYAAALAYVAIFAMLTDLGTSALSVREMARKEEDIAWMVPDIVALRAILSLVVIAIVTLSAWLLGKAPDMVLGIFIASCGLLLYAFQGPLDSVMIAQERLDFSSAFRLLNQMVFMILGTILLLVGAGYIGLLFASLIGVLAMGLASAYVVRRVLRLHFERPNPRHWWPLLRASFPFGIAGAVGEFASRFDTVFMSFVLTDAAVGWYNVPYNLIMMMLLLAQSLSLSMYPTLVREYDSGRGSIQNTVQRTLRYLLLLSLPIAVGGMLLADRIIVLLYGQDFASAIPVMQILVWTLPSMFLAEILGRTSSTLHLEKKAARISIINALIGVALNVALIPGLGVVGAAIAMLITRLAGIVLLSMIIGPAMLFTGNVRPLLRVVGTGALMGGVVWLLGNASFLAATDDKIVLLLLVGIGAVVYGTASLLLRAISPGEARYVYDVTRRRLGQLGHGK